ncbi:hypothetical protein QQP08_009603 [Theobroma cacao]|nr:hypothetical protein QQP08_009603 [Theobroma cacao]
MSESVTLPAKILCRQIIFEKPPGWFSYFVAQVLFWDMMTYMSQNDHSIKSGRGKTQDGLFKNDGMLSLDKQ